MKFVANKLNDYPNGTAKEICCSLDTSWLETVPGVKETKGFIIAQNLKDKDACRIGGMLKGFRYDPRIANCYAAALPSCEAKFKGECKMLPSGFVDNSCCDTSVFGESAEPKKPYSTRDRSKDDLALTKKTVEESNGQCHYGTTKDGKEDRFKVVCDTLNSARICVETISRPAETACAAKLSENGWVTSPCCERSPKALQINVRDADKTSDDVQAPSAKDVSEKNIGLTPESKSEGSRKMGTATRALPTNGDVKAPEGMGKKPLGGLGGLKSTAPATARPGTAHDAAPAASARATDEGRASSPVRRAPETSAPTGTRAGSDETEENYKP